jgi:tetratricopeptide (TPR) repeat protein
MVGDSIMCSKSKQCFKFMLLWVFVYFLVCFEHLFAGSGPATAWYTAMNEAVDLQYFGQKEQALALYEEALSLAPSDEHRADTLLYLAQAYEGLRLRSEAIETYKRIVADYPSSQHIPRVYFRLGEVHTSITLLPEKTDPNQERQIVEMQMTPKIAIPYFEQSVASSGSFDPWGLASRIYLAGRYRDTGFETKAWDIIHELANLNIYDVTKPKYVGPYVEMNASETTLCEWLDDARTLAARVRNSARNKLVPWSLSGGPMESIINLRDLTRLYPGTEIDPIDSEMFPIIELAKSPNQPERVQAVQKLLAIREAVSDNLAGMVVNAGSSQAEQGAKASAIFLIGELGLVQQKKLLEAEKDWKWSPPQEVIMHFNINERRRMPSLIGKSAVSALNRACFANGVSLIDKRKKTSLDNYPHLNDALVNLHAADRKVRRKSEDTILRWYDVVCRGFYSVLKPSRENLYSNEIKVTAAYLLGEYRSWHGQILLWNIDLKDEEAVCGQYYKTLAVQTSEPQYPCVVAMIKLGYRADIRSSLTRIQTKPQISQETRDRTVRVLTKIDKTATKKQYEKMVSALENVGKSSLTLEEKQERLQLLRSIERIVKE